MSDEALIEKNAVEIVKQMQKLRGIDGEYDSESHSSNRLAHRRTIHMLEKNRQKKRAIGTLDVAFKKRFFALSGAGQDPAIEGKSPRKYKSKKSSTKNQLCICNRTLFFSTPCTLFSCDLKTFSLDSDEFVRAGVHQVYIGFYNFFQKIHTYT